MIEMTFNLYMRNNTFVESDLFCVFANTIRTIGGRIKDDLGQTPSANEESSAIFIQKVVSIMEEFMFVTLVATCQ